MTEIVGELHAPEQLTFTIIPCPTGWWICSLWEHEGERGLVKTPIVAWEVQREDRLISGLRVMPPRRSTAYTEVIPIDLTGLDWDREVCAILDPHGVYHLPDDLEQYVLEEEIVEVLDKKWEKRRERAEAQHKKWKEEHGPQVG